MRVLIGWILIVASLSAHAQVYEEDENPSPHASGGHPTFILTGRGGFTVTPADPEVRDDWKHDPLFSYALSVGAHYAFPKSWKEFYFFAGGDFLALSSEEELRSSLSNSYVSTKIMQLLATVGMTWQPSFLGGRFGFDGTIGYELWGQKETEFQTSNYSRNLGVEATGSPVVWGLGGHFRLNGPWSALIAYNHRINDGGDIVWFGGRYGF